MCNAIRDGKEKCLAWYSILQPEELSGCAIAPYDTKLLSQFDKASIIIRNEDSCKQIGIWC